MTFEVVYNKALKIYSKLYVGIKPPNGSVDVPLGFVTPYTEDAAGLKRQATVKNWVGTSRYDHKTRKAVEYTPDLRIAENKPRSGFKITDDVKRVYWGGGNVVWRLEDPLGWEIEIQSSNLMAIIQACGIGAGGEIQGECIIARDGAHNILLPVISQEYKDAIKSAESAKQPSKIPMKDRVIGRTYRLLDGSFGTYLGKHWVAKQDHGAGDRRSSSEPLVFGVQGLKGGFKVETEIFSNDICRESELLEGVYVPESVLYPGETYSYKIGPKTRYYKSAPLIAELDQESFEAAKGLELANKSDMDWASSKNGKPCFAALVPHTKLKYTTRPIDKKTFAELRGRILREAECVQKTYQEQLQTHNQNGARPRPPHFTIAGLLRHWGNGFLIEDGDRLYENVMAINIADRNYSHYRAFDSTSDVPENDRLQDVLGLMEFTDFGYQVIRPKNYGAKVTRLDDSREQLTPTTIALPKFNTIEEAIAIIDALYVEDRIVEKYITTKESE